MDMEGGYRAGATSRWGGGVSQGNDACPHVQEVVPRLRAVRRGVGGTGTGYNPGGTAEAASEAGVEKVSMTAPVPGEEGGGGDPRAGTDAARRRSANVMPGRAAGAGLAEDALPEDGAKGRDGPRSGGAGAVGGR